MERSSTPLLDRDLFRPVAGFIDVVADVIGFLQGLFTSLRIARPRFTDVLAATKDVVRTGFRPVILVSFPFGMSFGLFFESLLGLLGMRSLGSAALVPAVIREEGPLVAGAVGAATFGAAICADIGSRKVRDELDAMMMMAVDPRARLYTPRILGAIIGCLILSVFSTMAGLSGGWFLIVLLRDTSSGQFLMGIEILMEPSDVYWLLVKGLAMGMIVGISACYCGSRAEGGPAGVAAAVRRSILVSFPIIVFSSFVVNQLVWGSSAPI